MNKKTLILFLSIFMLVSTGTSFNTQLTVVDRISMIDDPAIFNLTIQNEYEQNDNFRISSIQTPPITSTWFEYEYSKEISPDNNKTFRIVITPERNAIQQNYAFTLNIRSFRNQEFKTVQSFFTVSNKYDLKITDFQVDNQELKPGEKLNISATVQNTASQSLENFTVKTEAFDIEDVKEGAVLNSGNSIRYTFNINVPKREKPGEKNVSLVVTKDGEEAQSIVQRVKVNEVNKIERNSSIDDLLITKTETISIYNDGNTNVTENINRSLPVYLDPLTSFEPSPDMIVSNQGEQRYSWNIAVEPGKSETITYTVSYIPAITVIVFIFLGILGFKRIQTDIAVSKSFEKTSENVKIRIKIENKSNKAYNDLKIKDFVPDIAKVSKQFDMAKPVITKTKNGTRLEWDIDDLKSGEQRILEYSITPLVEVEGGVKLDAAEMMMKGEKTKQTQPIEVDFEPE